jgi:hypothetical protein
VASIREATANADHLSSTPLAAHCGGDAATRKLLGRSIGGQAGQFGQYRTQPLGKILG